MKYMQAEGVVKREIAGEVFLVPVKQRLADMQNLFVLHGCGEFVWDQLQAPVEADEIARRLCEMHDVPPGRAAADAAAFIAELEREGLVRAA